MTGMTLPLDVKTLVERTASGERFRFRHFWGHRTRADGVLTDSVFSQWYPSRFEVEGIKYTTAEQWMMASKARLFGDRETLEEILAEQDPAKVKALGRKVKHYDDAKWAERRFDLVTEGNLAKFGQDPRLREYLLSTGEDVIVEASPTDRIWGIGLAREDAAAGDPAKWRGLNLLGFALMRARAHFRDVKSRSDRAP